MSEPEIESLVQIIDKWVPELEKQIKEMRRLHEESEASLKEAETHLTRLKELAEELGAVV